MLQEHRVSIIEFSECGILFLYVHGFVLGVTV